MTTRRRVPSGGPTAAEQHRAWLELVDIDGPFLSVPALKKGWPAGMDAPRDAALAALRDARGSFENAWEKWDREPANPAAVSDYRAARDTWVETVLRDVVGWKAGWTTPLGSAVEVRSPDHAVTVHATGGFVHDEKAAALVLVVDPCASLRTPIDDGWAASPVDRMEELLRAVGVAIGVVTDGRWWAIVDAQPEVLVASGIVDALTWTEELAVRNAFVELLSVRSLVGGHADRLLPKLFKDSVAEAEEITEALGVQVRRAVELLVAALSESGVDAQRHHRPDPLPPDRAGVYEAAVTVMMQVVFLLFAQERGLLPQSSLFTRGYGIAGELDELERRFSDEQAEGLDATALTWHRLLATARAVYQGASFEDLRLPSYGGSLFDPTRFPWLTARTEQGVLAVSVSDRVMLEVLRAVQVARLKGEPARRISFRDIDVEQIGYIYEGLLGYSCARVETVMVGLIGKEGAEPEIALDELEELAEAHADPGKLADAILASVKASQPASVPKSRAAMVTGLRKPDPLDDAERALRAVTMSPGLRDRLRPFLGVIRRDLRNRPTVFEPGGVFVVETPSRATAGAHYTPRKLAEEVVRYALEPLVYEPGPHQEPDPDKWKLVRPEKILDLKVADIACGSGAFLVAAARYLAGKLVEAWHREGTDVGLPDELLLRATRQVVARCLYGADINAMAVEMAKLSLWLVSLDPKLPFSFVDDKVLLGNSLLGLIDQRQIEDMHIDPTAAGTMTIYTPGVDDTLADSIRLREELASEIDVRDPQRTATAKRRQWARYQDQVRELTVIADGVIAAGLRLGGKPGKSLNESYANLADAVYQAFAPDGPHNSTALDQITAAGLTPIVVTDYARWKPLHWILQVPDVIVNHGGFDAVIGNPPFLGGKKVSGAQGTNVREWLVNVIADGAKGNADLVAKFLLRGWSLLNRRGTLGLIATNTLAQGDTREVGLDQLDARGFTITRAVQSRSWPVASANLEYAAVWGTRARVSDLVPRIADDVLAEAISTLLEAEGRVRGATIRLNENLGRAFIGSYVNCTEFSMRPDQAAQMILADDRLSAVIFPYLGGEDLNKSPQATPARWIVDFTDILDSDIGSFGAAYDWIATRVKPVRARMSHKPRLQLRWWSYESAGLEMRQAIKGRPEILAIARVSKTVMPMRVSTGMVYHEKVVVFALDSYSDQAVLSSSLHQHWSTKFGVTMRVDPTYRPSAVFDTFPRPNPTDRLAEIGRTLDEERREIMLRRELGLTKLYNRVNDPDVTESDRDVARLREIHVDLDEAVMAAYGWDDVPLDHGFHTYRQMRRWTVSPAARVEILDRLLEENHRRAAAQGDAPPPPDEPDDEEEQ